MRLKLRLLKNLLNLLKRLKSERRHGYICPKTGLKVSTPPEKCIKYEESSKEEIIFVPVDEYLLKFAKARSKLKRESDN